jgi:hypothetical protein
MKLFPKGKQGGGGQSFRQQMALPHSIEYITPLSINIV